jgi:dimethylamine corrinoid protein
VSSESLVSALLDGDSSLAVRQARALLDTDPRAGQAIVASMEAAMQRLDGKCTAEEFDLLEIMLSGRAVTEVMKVLYPSGAPAGEGKGTVVVATLEGDIHDLGKSILKMVLIGNGYRVVDCGVDCPLERLAQTATAEEPLAVGVSGLLSTAVFSVRRARQVLDAYGLERVRLIAGGAALKQSSAAALNVDYLAESAFDGVHYLERIRAGLSKPERERT